MGAVIRASEPNGGNHAVPYPELEPEPELSGSEIVLCNGGGRLNHEAIGWTRRPVHLCSIPGRWPRKKKWNDWCVFNANHFFSVRIASLDYAAFVHLCLANLSAKTVVQETISLPLARGCELPDSVREPVHFKRKSIRLDVEPGVNSSTIQVESSSGEKGPFSANITVRHPTSLESVNVVVPLGKDHFQFASKQLCLPASGAVKTTGGTATFNEAEAFASMDFGRGVWPTANFWNSAVVSTVQDGHTIGINLSGGWTDGTGMTENAIILDGKVVKVSEEIEFGYGGADSLTPWTINTKHTEQVTLEFAPAFHWTNTARALFVRSTVKQVAGHFSGSVVTDSGDKIAVRNALGWTQEHTAKW